jgi:hypothetical protein
MYLDGTSPRTWRVHTVCVYILKIYIFLLFSLEADMGNTWTKNDNGTKLSFGSGQSPKRIGLNTRPSRGVANIVGFVHPTLSVWNNTGADCASLKYSPPEPRLLRNRPRSGAPAISSGPDDDLGDSE